MQSALWPASAAWRHRSVRARGVRALALPALVAALPALAAELETVVVTGTRAPQSTAEVAASIRVVNQQDLQLVNAVHVSEALTRVPGTWISRGNGQEHLTAIRSPVLTGPGSCGAFYLAEDGLRLRPAGTCNVNELSEVNSEQAARIEVLRGPGTAVHGGNAQHGVVNVISTPPPESRAASVRLTGGPNDYARLLGSYGDAGSRGAWRVSLNTTHDGGYKDDSGYDLQKLSYRHDAEWSGIRLQSLLSLGNLNQETAGFVVGEDAYKDSDQQKANPFPEAFRDNQFARWYGRFTLDAGGGELAVTPYLRYQDMRFLQHFLTGQPLEENGSSSAGWQGEWRVALADSLAFMAGLDGEWSDSYLQETQRVLLSASSVFPQGKHYDYTVQGINGALFSQLSWTPRTHTRIDAGLRLEYQRYDYDNRMLDGATREYGSPCGRPGAPLPCRYFRPGDREDEFTEPALHVGLLQDVGSGQELVLAYAHGFRPPGSAELYRLQAGQDVAGINPEETDSLEGGWRGAHGRLEWQLSAFYMQKHDIIFQDADRRNVSNARSKHRGVEYSVEWRLADHWALAADGTWALHRYDGNARLQGLPAGTDINRNDMDTAPRAMASVRLSWLPSSDTAAELEWVHMGRYFLEPTDSFDYDGHDLLHLRLSHRLSPRLALAARVTNLTDVQYADRADYAFGDYRYFIGEPRSLFVDFDWQL
jgi:outer membrane receptor protein involved in Fe transport